VRKAFERARAGHETVMAFTDHDFRDMRPDVAAVHALVTKVARDYPDVTWRNSGALVAARAALGLEPPEPLVLETELRRDGDRLLLTVEANHDTFGPQPFLAVKSHDQAYSFDNLDVQEPFRRWSYVFDEQSFRPRALEAVGVASADRYGQTCVVVLDPSEVLRG